MSATGLEVFDKTLQTTNVWLDEIMAEIGPDRQIAWKVLSTVLRKLRDRLRVEDAAHLSAQLPLLVRGVYYDQYEPASQPVDCDTVEEFTTEVAEWLADVRPINAQDATRAVLRVLSRHLDEGQVKKTQGVLPSKLREFWQAAAAESGPAER